MSWRDDAQRSKVASCLLGLVGRDDLWHAVATLGVDPGPTPLALDFLETRGGPLSSGEAVMLRLAFDAWNGNGGVSIAEILATLSPRLLAPVGRLLVAYAESSDAIDAWIEEVSRA